MLKLDLGNLYIVPSGLGGLWLLAGAVLYVVGINGRSNGPVLLSLLMLALLLLNLVLTHHTLQGLELQCLDAEPSCADAPASVPLLAISQRPRAAIRLRWLNPAGQAEQPPLQLPAGRTTLTLPWQPGRRGLQQPGLLLLSTTAPMGLFRCWAYWEPPVTLPIAPARQSGPVRELQRPDAIASCGAMSETPGSDHFEELRPLRPQEGLQRVAWKNLARGQGWYGKHFSADDAGAVWLSPAPGLEQEQALEHLCARLCSGLAGGQRLGLLLNGGVEIPPASGAAQLRQCLAALAALPA